MVIYRRQIKARIKKKEDEYYFSDVVRANSERLRTCTRKLRDKARLQIQDRDRNRRRNKSGIGPHKNRRYTNKIGTAFLTFLAPISGPTHVMNVAQITSSPHIVFTHQYPQNMNIHPQRDYYICYTEKILR